MENLDDKEIWKPVVGYEALYEVSSYGRIRSIWILKRNVNRQRIKPKMLKLKLLSGYRKIRLYNNTKKKEYYVHKLVLDAFVSTRPKGLEACHNDGNRKNNKASNLRWDTKKNNNIDKFLHKTNGFKLTAEDVVKIRQLLSEKTNQRTIARLFGVTDSNISSIKYKKTWNWDDL